MKEYQPTLPPVTQGGLDIAAAKEQYSYAYVKAMCAAAGVNYSEMRTDNESIDIELIGSGFSGKWKRPRVLAQLKCTSRFEYFDSKMQSIRYPLSIKNYNDLRETDDLPKILIVVFCPVASNEWVQWNPISSQLRFSGYWTRLVGEPEVPNKSTISVEVPFSQPFNNVTLIDLLKNLSEGGRTL
ncbi:DUF4365 domain-containing protein [Microbulbifer sp. JMSA008]|uniref:DUF4365 domain-containing protein n=1 Tax=Microbulbifer sp. JMSA008 TaxID=3243373 RepID=UPI0040392BD7